LIIKYKIENQMSTKKPSNQDINDTVRAKGGHFRIRIFKSKLILL